jgi:probable F420-dependent oxidoreductase
MPAATSRFDPPVYDVGMKFCLGLTFSNPDYFLELAPLAEAHGYDTVMLSDHLVHHEVIASKYPYTELGARAWTPQTAWPDVWVATGMMAAVTRRLRFLQNVYVLPMRDPFHVAKALGTAARLSGYRVGLGLGLGWLREEFELLGVDFHARGRRADEMIEVMRKLWTGELVEHRGEFFRFDRLSMSPAVGGPVPIIVGGISEAALRRAARLGDGWAPAYLTIDGVRQGVEQIRKLRRAYGRPDAPLAVYGSCTDAHGLDGYRRMEEAGVTHTGGAPWLLYGDDGSAGAHGIDISRMLNPSLQRMRDGLRRFADDVIAKLG